MCDPVSIAFGVTAFAAVASSAEQSRKAKSVATAQAGDLRRGEAERKAAEDKAAQDAVVDVNEARRRRRMSALATGGKSDSYTPLSSVLALGKPTTGA